MKGIMISGSRNPSGRTAQAAQALLEGLAAKGVECEEVFLPTMKIKRCGQCNDNGWGTCRSEGRCAIDDDLPGIVGKIRESDLVVFANPVYFGDLSESLRAFLDRLRRITRNDAGKERITEKPAVGICVAGGGGGGAPNCCLALEKVLQTCGFNVLDVIPVRRQNLQAKLPVLTQTGLWVADAAGNTG